jgi:hypothetical protein
MTALRRSAAGITAGATLAFAVLAAIAADAGHAGPGPPTAADGSGETAMSGSVSPAAVTRVSGVVSPVAAASPEPTNPDPGTSKASAAAVLGPAPSRLLVPDLVASVPGGFTTAQVARIGALSRVRAVLPVDGAQVTVNGKSASVLGVSPQAFRAWAPPTTAADADIWTALVSGDLVASQAGGSRLALTPGTVAQLSGAVSAPVIVAATTQLGLPSIDAVVDLQRAAQLGLEANVAVLINAPGANLAGLTRQVLSVTGPSGRVVNLVPVASTVQLPVKTNVRTGTPTNYLELYQESAAEYCPGLSWTVLAAIGQIESGHGTNDGPSSAGALGPMQFLPSTWAVWGTDGFGQTGPPNIMNPLDAVPSAARMLCADGAAAGGASLEAAIYDYNHASWYISEVLTLAHEYAQEYP